MADNKRKSREGDAGKTGRYKPWGLKTRPRGLNPKHILEIEYFLKVTEQCSNKRVVSEKCIQQLWWIFSISVVVTENTVFSIL